MRKGERGCNPGTTWPLPTRQETVGNPASKGRHQLVKVHYPDMSRCTLFHPDPEIPSFLVFRRNADRAGKASSACVGGLCPSELAGRERFVARSLWGNIPPTNR